MLPRGGHIQATVCFGCPFAFLLPLLRPRLIHQRLSELLPGPHGRHLAVPPRQVTPVALAFRDGNGVSSHVNVDFPFARMIDLCCGNGN